LVISLQINHEVDGAGEGGIHERRKIFRLVEIDRSVGFVWITRARTIWNMWGWSRPPVVAGEDFLELFAAHTS
jgi:hypothetical protein